MMVTKEEFQGNWNSFLGGVQKKYSEITGDDLASVKGNIQQMAGVIQRKTGQAREEIEKHLQSLTADASGALGHASEVASNLASKANEGLREGYNYVAEKSQDGYDSARATVREKPVETLAIAFGIGVVAGLIAGCSVFGRKN
jgi:uncharacterized protein YjbJ (UPF0337 family)